MADSEAMEIVSSLFRHIIHYNLLKFYLLH
jgi:hypothetical protein